MSKVMILSRTYPAYHPKAGQPTYFPEKFLNWFWDATDHNYFNVPDMLEELNYNWMPVDMETFSEQLDREIKEDKGHTIRAGHRFKAGDYFSPRVWSGKPYNSNQIILAPDIEVKKVWNFEIEDFGDPWPWVAINGTELTSFKELAKNDGLTVEDLKKWFKYPKTFKGQIICWNDKIQY